MECPHCRLSTSLEDGRCALCGWSLALCPDCEAANDAAARRCSACGRLLVEDASERPVEEGDDSAEPHHIY